MYKADVYLRVRRAVMVEGMRVRQAATTFGLHRDTVRKMLEYSVPPGYRRQVPPRPPTLRQAQDSPYTGVIDRILVLRRRFSNSVPFSREIASWHARAQSCQRVCNSP